MICTEEMLAKDKMGKRNVEYLNLLRNKEVSQMCYYAMYLTT